MSVAIDQMAAQFPPELRFLVWQYVDWPEQGPQASHVLEATWTDVVPNIRWHVVKKGRIPVNPHLDDPGVRIGYVVRRPLTRQPNEGYDVDAFREAMKNINGPRPVRD